MSKQKNNCTGTREVVLKIMTPSKARQIVFKVKYNGKIKNSQKRPIIPWNIEFHIKPKYP